MIVVDPHAKEVERVHRILLRMAVFERLRDDGDAAFTGCRIEAEYRRRFRRSSDTVRRTLAVMERRGFVWRMSGDQYVLVPDSVAKAERIARIRWRVLREAERRCMTELMKGALHRAEKRTSYPVPARPEQSFPRALLRKLARKDLVVAHGPKTDPELRYVITLDGKMMMDQVSDLTARA